MLIRYDWKYIRTTLMYTIAEVEYKNLEFTAILYSGVHKRQYLFRIFVCNHILLSMLINNTHQSITWEKKDEGFLRM